ncbi:MAG: hypothetical protein NTX12_03580 [Actinobacteria bacterium]|nr:hypothetical protein [Actinomycetota bacterium]
MNSTRSKNRSCSWWRGWYFVPSRSRFC